MSVVMQTRCIHCKKEQWAMIVYSLSYGKEVCTWCNKGSKKLSRAEYWKLYELPSDSEELKQIAMEYHDRNK